MPRKKPDSALTFTVETFDDPETGKPTPYGCFSRNWQDEEALDQLLEQLQSGLISDKQALMQARKLEATKPYNLETQNFIANRLWALGLQDDAAEVYERAYTHALAVIPKGFKGQITWSDIDNRPFLRLAHGTLLGLMHQRKGKAAMALAQQMLAWCATDNMGVRFLLGDIGLLQGDHATALQLYLKDAQDSPAHWYQAALITFRQRDYVAACTYLRRGIAANPYIAQGLTGHTVLMEHLYWHASNVNGPEWARAYLDSAACDWAPEEADFVDWVFNSAAILKERAKLAELHEAITHERDPVRRGALAEKRALFDQGITPALSKKLARKVRNRYDQEGWPWDRAGLSGIRHEPL